jgi:hypothetical protein
MALTQCRECPWRDLASVPDYAVDHARKDPTGFMCHTRCIPCPGPVLVHLDGEGE